MAEKGGKIQGLTQLSYASANWFRFEGTLSARLAGTPSCLCTMHPPWRSPGQFSHPGPAIHGRAFIRLRMSTGHSVLPHPTPMLTGSGSKGLSQPDLRAPLAVHVRCTLHGAARGNFLTPALPHPWQGVRSAANVHRTFGPPSPYASANWFRFEGTLSARLAGTPSCLCTMHPPWRSPELFLRQSSLRPRKPDCTSAVSAPPHQIYRIPISSNDSNLDTSSRSMTATIKNLHAWAENSSSSATCALHAQHLR